MKRNSLLLLLSFMLISGCGATRKLATTTEVTKADTSTVLKVRIIDYKPMANLNLGIGQTFQLQDANLKVTRIDSSRAIVEQLTEVITKKETTYKLIPTKTIDRSKDKSVKDSNVKDKSQTGSNNKSKKSGNEKVKQNNKQVTRGFPWTLILVVVIIIVLGRYLVKKYFKNG